MAKAHGRHGEIQIGSGSPFTIIGSLNAWTVNGDRDLVDVTSFGDENKNFLAGLKNASGTFAGFFDTAYIRALMEASDSATGTNFRITPSTDYPEFYVTGPIWLSVSWDGAVNDAVKISATFSANGAWIYQLDGSPL
jgi:hypothetical protein